MKSLKVYGKDYTPIKLAEFRLDGFQCDEVIFDDGSVLKLDENTKEKIVIMVLEASSDVERNYTNKSNSKKPLYEDYLGLRFGGYVGVLSKRIIISQDEFDILQDRDNSIYQNEYCLDVVLQIQSRFDKAPRKPFFLINMLMSEEDVKGSDQYVPTSDEELFDFLLLIRFRECLQTAYMKGFYRTYHTFNNNDDRVRGSLDIARHLRENMGLNNGRAAYQYREKTVDNYLNHLIVTAYYYFKRKRPELIFCYFDSNAEIKKIIDMLCDQIQYPKYGIRSLILKNIDKISHPYYFEYEALRMVSLRILRDESTSIFDSDFDETEGIVFYLPDLFENYMEHIFGKHGISVSAQQDVKIYSFENEPSRFIQTTRPDYIFYSDNMPYMVLDAKFKPEWGKKTAGEETLSSTRLLSDYDKCIRDMNSLNCHATGVVFPTDALLLQEKSGYLKHGISIHNSMDNFYTISLYIPDNSVDYAAWLNSFNKYCSGSMEELQRILQEELEFRNRIDQDMKAALGKR